MSNKKNIFVIDVGKVAIGQPIVTVLFRTAQCHKCGRLGHIKRMCQSKKALRGEGTSNSRPTQTESKNSSVIRNVQNESTTETEYSLHNINSPVTTKLLMVYRCDNSASIHEIGYRVSSHLSFRAHV